MGMAQGPPLLSVGCSANVTPNGGHSCALSPTCKSFSQHQLPAAATTNPTGRQGRHSEVGLESTALLHSSRHSAITSPEKIVDGVCEHPPPAEAFARSKSWRDVSRAQAPTDGLAALRFSVAGGAGICEEASWTQWESPRFEGSAIEKPTGLLITERRNQCETTDHEGRTRRTEPLGRGKTRSVKESTLCDHSPSTQEAEVTNERTNAFSTDLRLPSAHDTLVLFRECTQLPPGNRARLGVRGSIAVAADPECTANTEALASFSSGTRARVSTESTAAFGGVISVVSPRRAREVDAGGRNAALVLTLPHAPTPAPLLAVPAAAPAGPPVTRLTPAAPKCAAAAEPSVGPHFAALHRHGKGMHQDSPPLVYHGREGTYWYAEYSEARRERVIQGSAKHGSCLVEKGDTTEPSSFLKKVQQVPLNTPLGDAKAHSGWGIALDMLSGAGTLERSGGDESGCSKRKGSAECARGTNRKNNSSGGSGTCSIGSNHVHDGSIVNRCVARNPDDKEATSSSSCSKSSVDYCSGCSSRGDRELLYSSASPFSTRVDSCISTTVSTPSPAAASTPRSVHGSPNAKDTACYLVSGCTTCASCVDSRSSDIGMTCTETGPCKHGTSLVAQGSPASWLKCSCCCRPFSTVLGSGSTVPVTRSATTRGSFMCMHDGEHKAMRAPPVQKTSRAACINGTTQRPAAADIAKAAHHHLSVLCKETWTDARSLPVEELLLPAAVVLPASALPREQQHRQLPQNPTLHAASNPLENALLQAAASVTPVTSSKRNGRVGWGCNGSSPWENASNSTCSPSVFSQVPIVPLSAWPVPATHVCDDGAARLDTPTQRDSPDPVECSPCSRRCGGLISCHSWSENCKCEETVFQPERFANESNDLLRGHPCAAPESRRRLLRRQLHLHPFARSLSGTAERCRVQRVSPRTVEGPTRYTKSLAQVNAATPATETENGAAFPDGSKFNGSYPLITAGTAPLTSQLQLPFRSHAEGWLFLQVACASTASVSQRRVQDPAGGAADFCSSTLRTATLLLGDHDPEVATSSAFSLYDSNSVDAQRQREELYSGKTCGNGETTIDGPGYCDVQASGEKSCSSNTADGHTRTLEATNGHDNVQKMQPLQLISAIAPGSVVSSGVTGRIAALRCTEETADCPETAPCPAQALHVTTGAAYGGSAPQVACCSVTPLKFSPLGPAAERLLPPVRCASSAHSRAGHSTQYGTDQNMGTTFPQSGLACSVEQSCGSDRHSASTEEKGRRRHGTGAQHQERTSYVAQQHEENEVSELRGGDRCKQQEQDWKAREGSRTGVAGGNEQTAVRGTQACLAAALGEEAHIFGKSAVQTGRLDAKTSTREASAAAMQGTNTEFPRSERQLQSCLAEPTKGPLSLADARDIGDRDLLAHSQSHNVPVEKTYSHGQHSFASCDLKEEGSAPRTTADASAKARAAPAATAAVPGIAAVASDFRPKDSVILHAEGSNCQPDASPSSLALTKGVDDVKQRKCEELGDASAKGRSYEELAGARIYEGDHTHLMQECVVAPARVHALGTPSPPRHRRENKQGVTCTSAERKSRTTAVSDSRRCSRSSSCGSVSSTSTQSGLPSYWTSRSSSTRCSPLSSRRPDPLAAPPTAANAGPPSAAADLYVSAANLLSSIPTLNLKTLQHSEVHKLGDTSFPPKSRQCNHRHPAVAPASDDAHRNLAGSTQWGASAFNGSLTGVTSVSAAQGQVRPSLGGKEATASTVPLQSPRAAPPLHTDNRPQPAQHFGRPHRVCGTDDISAEAFAVGENDPPVSDPQAAVGLVAATAGANEAVQLSREVTAKNVSSHILGLASRLGDCAPESPAPAALESVNVLPCKSVSIPHQPGTPPFLPAANTLSGDEENCPKAVGGTATQNKSFPAKRASSTVNLPAERVQAHAGPVGPIDQKELGAHRTQWFRRDNSEHTLRRETRGPPVSAAISGMHSNGTSSSVKHQKPLHYLSQHRRHPVQDEELLQYKRQESQHELSVQRHWSQQLHGEQTEEVPQSYTRHHHLRPRHIQGLIAPAEQGVLQGENLNTRLGSPDYVKCADCSSRRISAEERPGGVNDLEQKNNSNHSKCSGVQESATQAGLHQAIFAAQAAFVHDSTADCANEAACSSTWESATGDCGGTQSSFLKQGHPGGKDVLVTDNFGHVKIQAVEDSNYALDTSYQSGQSFAAASVQVSTVNPVSATSRYSTATALSSTIGHSFHNESRWNFFEGPASSSEDPQAPASVHLVSAPSPSGLGVLPGPSMEAVENRQVQRQLLEGQPHTKSASMQLGLSSGQASHAALSLPMLEGLQGPAAAPAGSEKPFLHLACAKTEPGAEELADGGGIADCPAENKVCKKATRNFQRSGPHAHDARQDGPESRHARFNSVRARRDQAEDERGGATAAVCSAHEKASVLLGSIQRAASETDLVYKQPQDSDTTEAPAYGGAAASPPAGAPCVVAGPTGAVASVLNLIEEKSEDGVQQSAGTNDDYDERKKPEREHLLTMSDSRQLRLCPELRQAAAAIGGGGVRCATTKQLYQLAELCGFDDVLPPEFRRPRSSTEHPGVDSAAANDRTATRFGTTDSTLYSRREKDGSKSCSTALRPFSSSSKRCAASGAAASSSGCAALRTAVSCRSALGADTDEPGHPENSRRRSLFYLSSTPPEGARTFLDSSLQQQPASVSEEWQQEQQPRPLPTGHDAGEEKRRKSKQLTTRGSSEATPMIQAVQHDTTTWPVSVAHSWEGEQSTDWQQHCMQQAQYHHQPPLKRHGQLYSPQHPPQNQARPHPPSRPGYSQPLDQQRRCQQEQRGHLQLQHPQHCDLQHLHPKLPVVSHALQDSSGLYNACENATIVQDASSAQHLQQQTLSLQVEQDDQRPKDFSGNCSLLQEQQTQPFQLEHLLEGELTPSHSVKMLHETYTHRSPEISQRAVQSESAQNQSYWGNPHMYAGTAAPRAIIPLNVPGRSAVSSTSAAQTSFDVEAVSASERSAASVVASASAHASVLTLLGPAGSIAADSCATSRTDCWGSALSYTSERTSTHICNSTRGHLETSGREITTPATPNVDSAHPVKQGCRLSDSLGRCADQQLLHNQQQRTRPRLSRVVLSGADERVLLGDRPSSASDSVGAPSVSAAAPVSECRPGDPAEVTSYTAIAGPAADTGHERRNLLHHTYSETDVSPAECAGPPAAGPCLSTEKVCALQPIPPLFSLSQSAQGSSPPGSSPQSWGGNGTSTTLTCGSCSTKSSRSCLAEDARSMTVTAQEEPNKEAVAEVELAAVQAVSEGSPGVLPVDAPPSTTAGAAAENCFSSPTAEQGRNFEADVQTRMRQVQNSPQPRLPRKRCRIDTVDNSARQCSASSAIVARPEDQHHPEEQRFLGKCDIAHQRHQSRKSSGAGNAQESCQQLTVLSHVPERKQPHKGTVDLNMEEHLVTQPQQQQLSQQHAQEPHVSQQRAWGDDSPLSPCSVFQPSELVGAGRYNSTDERAQMSGEQTASGLTAGRQPQYDIPTYAPDCTSLKNTPPQRGYCESMPCWQKVSCSGADNPSFGTNDIYDHTSGGVSGIWIPAVDTCVVDEMFNVQSTSGIESPSDRVHPHHDGGNLTNQFNDTS